ncbi:hypothetical protein [Euzebya rosea]|uniref:hypothetical protein n=1 Tax=Euzebya rosea TaxID=2052804 RepID=UPI00130050EC|nr:hypothetical protein [Euzebya rosea]
MSVIVVTQSLGVLVAHSHIDAVGDGGQHAHSYVADADGHTGHPDDATPADGEHLRGQPTARLYGLVLLLALAFAAVMRGERSADQSTGPVLHGLWTGRLQRRQATRLALLAILRI